MHESPNVLQPQTRWGKRSQTASTIAAFMLSVCCAGSAEAGWISYGFTTNSCSTGCLVSPAGTITITEVAPGDLQFSIALDSNYSFRASSDPNHHGFSFNLGSGFGTITVSNVTANQTFSLVGAGTYNDAGFGSFNYYMACTTCVGGIPTTPTQTLTFDLLGNSSLTLAALQRNANGFNFAIDVVGITSTAGAGNTGNFGNGPQTGGVPEPATVGLVGASLAAVSARRLFLRRRGNSS